MRETPSINIGRFKPKKIHSKYWVKFLLYGLILGALVFWFKEKTKNNVKLDAGLEQTQLNLKGVLIEE
jgi:hypothetical protein